MSLETSASESEEKNETSVCLLVRKLWCGKLCTDFYFILLMKNIAKSSVVRVDEGGGGGGQRREENVVLKSI